MTGLKKNHNSQPSMNSTLGYQTISEYIDHGDTLRHNDRGLSVVHVRRVYDFVARDIAPRASPSVVRELLYLLRFTIGYGKVYFAHGAHRCSRGKVGSPKLNAPPNGASPRTTQRSRALIVENGWFDCEHAGRGSGVANVYCPSDSFLLAALEKRDDVVYGNADTLLVVKEYERLIDEGAGLTAAQFACALWCVYALRSTATYSDDRNGSRFASWASLSSGKWSRQRRLIFPAINLGRTAMKEAFRALEGAGYIRITHRTRRPCLFTMPTQRGALAAFDQRGAANDAAASPIDSRSDTVLCRLEYSRALHDLRRERGTVWLRRVWMEAVELRDRTSVQHTMLADADAQLYGLGLISHLRDAGIRSEVDQRRFLFFAASHSSDPQWYQIEHLFLLNILDPLIAQYRALHAPQSQAA